MSAGGLKGEDWDFVLVNIITLTQSLIPKSVVPTETMWTNVCCNINQLQDLKTKHLEMIDVKGTAYSGYRKQELTAEINERRFGSNNLGSCKANIDLELIRRF